ncbi:hypothetical protein B0H16DRAFT_316644 [Mycena metata]|uniref:Uncharacterized protein n=1 Tax=Mycena metata TaxID=1033252 RepID=A0AAD7JPA0_9AGAR|nr:hypothetical protein B0H16DRAFT_316644 [Mycena metata]
MVACVCPKFTSAPHTLDNSGSVPGLGLSPISPTKQPSRISPPSSLDSGSTGSCPCTQYHTMPEDNTRRDMRTSRDFLVFVYINLLNTVLIFLHLSLDFSQGCTTGLITETLLLFYAVKCVVFVTLLFRLIAIAIYSSFERTQNKASLKVESQVLEVRGRLIQDDRYPFARGANSHIYKGRIILPEGSERRVSYALTTINLLGWTSF